MALWRRDARRGHLYVELLRFGLYNRNPSRHAGSVGKLAGVLRFCKLCFDVLEFVRIDILAHGIHLFLQLAHRLVSHLRSSFLFQDELKENQG